MVSVLGVVPGLRMGSQVRGRGRALTDRGSVKDRPGTLDPALDAQAGMAPGELIHPVSHRWCGAPRQAFGGSVHA